MNAPPHQISESNGTRTIDIQSWTLESITAPISNASESDALQASLGFPLPEMTFGNNALVLRHNPSGWEYRFDAENALKCVKSGELQAGDGGVKVGYADAWLKSRSVRVTLSYTYGVDKLIRKDSIPIPPCHSPKLLQQSPMIGHTHPCILAILLPRTSFRSLQPIPKMHDMPSPLQSLRDKILYFSTRRYLYTRMSYMIMECLRSLFG